MNGCMGNGMGGGMNGGMGGNMGDGMGGGMGSGMGGMDGGCGMNPMMMGMMGMMGMMMNNMMQQNQGSMGGGGNEQMQMQMQMPSASASRASSAGEDRHLDPRVRDLCREFGIGGDTVMKLGDAMKAREDYEEDLQVLHKLMERATRDGKKPLEVMLAQIRALKSDKFPGKDLLDPDIWDFIVRFKLDDRVMKRLVDTFSKVKQDKIKTVQQLTERLNNVQDPKLGLGLLVTLLEGLEETGRMPSPPRRLGGSGTFRPTGTFLHPKNRDSSKGESRRRSRSRGRDSRSRGRGR